MCITVTLWARQARRPQDIFSFLLLVQAMSGDAVPADVRVIVEVCSPDP